MVLIGMRKIENGFYRDRKGKYVWLCILIELEKVGWIRLYEEEFLYVWEDNGE